MQSIVILTIKKVFRIILLPADLINGLFLTLSFLLTSNIRDYMNDDGKLNIPEYTADLLNYFNSKKELTKHLTYIYLLIILVIIIY
jgi:hypothetical protein